MRKIGFEPFQILSNLGINFINNPISIINAMSFVSIPFVINSSYNGFLSVPIIYEKTAINIGVSNLKVFFTIYITMAGKSIISGLVLMWARGMSEFGAVRYMKKGEQSG